MWTCSTRSSTLPNPKASQLLQALDDLHRLLGGWRPPRELVAEAPTLTSWRRLGDALVGVVANHPTIPDGHICLTSPIVWLDQDERLARTISRFYRLADPDLRLH